MNVVFTVDFIFPPLNGIGRYLCCRLRLAGYRVFLAPAAVAAHDGRRDSHRRPVFFLRHLRSMVRFFLTPSYLKCRFKLRADGGGKRGGRPM